MTDGGEHAAWACEAHRSALTSIVPRPQSPRPARNVRRLRHDADRVADKRIERHAASPPRSRRTTGRSTSYSSARATTATATFSVRAMSEGARRRPDPPVEGAERCGIEEDHVRRRRAAGPLARRSCRRPRPYVMEGRLRQVSRRRRTLPLRAHRRLAATRRARPSSSTSTVFGSSAVAHGGHGDWPPRATGASSWLEGYSIAMSQANRREATDDDGTCSMCRACRSGLTTSCAEFGGYAG